MSVKIFLFKKSKDSEGPHALTIRITKNRKSSYIYLGQNILESQWDADNQRVKKSHPNSTRLNNLLLTKLAEANDMQLEMDTSSSTVSPKAIKAKLKPNAGITFFKQAELYIDNLKKRGKYNSVGADQPRINRFKEFLKQEDIAFQDITVSLLTRFGAFLKSTRSISERTVVNHLIVIRSIYSQAIKEGIVDAKHYPFGKGKTKIKFPESVKIGLTTEEVQRLEELEVEPGSNLDHARNLWLFSFYFAGMRISDVLRLKWSDFQNDRLYYAMGKNSKAGSLKVPELALAILSYYKTREAKNDLVFPDLEVLDNLDNPYEVQRKISYAVKRLDGYLSRVATQAKISKKLTMHIARHTFGNISGDKISVQMLQKLYRHSSITTTIGYQANFMHKDADDALDAVTGFTRKKRS